MSPRFASSTDFFLVELCGMAGSSAASCTASSPTATTTSSATATSTAASTGASTASSGVMTTCTGAGSGALRTSGIGTSSVAGSVATVPPTMTAPVSVSATWPTSSAAFGSAMPSTGAFPAAPYMIPQYAGGGFGMKLDNKPPVMQGSFDLYAVQLKTFLTRLNLGCVVENEAAVRASVSDVQFAMMDNVARGAILHGVPIADAELICHEMSAQAMWTSFVNKQTKREYANYISARQRLYANRYSQDHNMNEWLREMQLLRNELLHYKKVNSDEEFAEILLSNVVQTHREVVRQFSKHCDPGYQRSAPSSAQVMNALRAESELDARSDDTPPAYIISSTQAGKKGQGKP
ncbi:hypothetical protein ON010_g18418 [Phytophthora cinnamomi]|nr:hypothetical protein ON010_g18418 [Phytophthora cinnamomi]